MTAFSLISLAEHPEYEDIIAAWNMGYWSITNLKRDPTFERSKEAFVTNLKIDNVPMTLIAIDDETKRPIGMASLWTKDSDYWTEQTPWIASLFIHELYRGKNIAKLLINTLENRAAELGYEYIYLTAAESVADLYRTLRYEQIDQRQHENALCGIEYLFRKALK